MARERRSKRVDAGYCEEVSGYLVGRGHTDTNQYKVATTGVPDTAVAAERSKKNRSRLWYGGARKRNHREHE